MHISDNHIKYNRVAIFIDVDNLVIAADNAGLPVMLGPIIERIREEGQIIFVRAYGDWAQPHVSRYLHEFRKHTIEMTQISTAASGKNTADVHLAVEALEMTLLPSAPDTIVIVSGDRDFVPLVQKMKRYGKMVMGIGVKGSTSTDLAMACNIFLFAYEILGNRMSQERMPSPRVQLPDGSSADEMQIPVSVQTSQPELEIGVEPAANSAVNKRSRKAFALLVRAVASLARQGQQALGSNTRSRMQQLNPTFYPERFGYSSFKEFVLAAQNAGYVKLILSKQGDFHFDANFNPSPELMHIEADHHDSDEDYAPNAPDLNFDTVDSAFKSYRLILQRYKRLELIPWEKRKELVGCVWQVLERSGDAGSTLDELIGELKMYTMTSRCWVEDKAIELLVRTLCIAQCFTSDEGIPHYYDVDKRVKPAVDVDEALFLMNFTYLNGIRIAIPSTPFVEEAVAMLLFDEVNENTLAEAARVIARVSGGDEECTNTMADAFQRAGSPGNSDN